MRVRWTHYLILLGLVMFVGCGTEEAAGSPPAASISDAVEGGGELPLSSGNLLINPDFDPPYVIQSFREGKSASPWLLAWCDACPAPERLTQKNPKSLVMGRPEWGPGDERFCGEDVTCQEWFSTYRTSFGGVYQFVIVPDESTCTFGARVFGIASTNANLSDTEFPNADARRTLSFYLIADPTGGIDFWDFNEENEDGVYPLLDRLTFEHFNSVTGFYDGFTDIEMSFKTEGTKATVAIFGQAIFPVRHPAFYIDRAWLECE